MCKIEDEEGGVGGKAEGELQAGDQINFAKNCLLFENKREQQA